MDEEERTEPPHCHDGGVFFNLAQCPFFFFLIRNVRLHKAASDLQRNRMNK